MEAKQNGIDPQTLRKTKFVYWFIFSAALFIFAASLSLAKMELQHWWPDDLLVWSFLLLSLAFLPVSYLGSHLLGKQLITRAIAKNNAANLREALILWMLIRLSMAMVALMFSSIGYMLTSNLLLFLVALVAMSLLLSYRPSENKFDDLLTKARKG